MLTDEVSRLDRLHHEGQDVLEVVDRDLRHDSKVGGKESTGSHTRPVLLVKQVRETEPQVASEGIS